MSIDAGVGEDVSRLTAFQETTELEADVRVATTFVGEAGGTVLTAVPMTGVPSGVDRLLHEIVSVARML
jgi:hypothetical protein